MREVAAKNLTGGEKRELRSFEIKVVALNWKTLRSPHPSQLHVFRHRKAELRPPKLVGDEAKAPLDLVNVVLVHPAPKSCGVAVDPIEPVCDRCLATFESSEVQDFGFKVVFSALFAIERLTVDLVSPVQLSILRKVAMSTSCKEGGSLRLPDAVGVATAPVSCLLAECLGGEPAAEIAVCDPTGEQGCAPEEDAAVSCLSLCRFEGASEAESFREPSML